MYHLVASMGDSDIKACVIIMLSGEEKKTSSHPSGWNVLLSEVALMSGILCLLRVLLINIYAL